jgi:serine/threonine protein kinase/Flp pilus assembly protein TadD
MNPISSDANSQDLNDFIWAYENAQQNGDAGALADFLPSPEHPLYLDVLRELIRIDLEYRWDRGQPRPLEDYREHFPELFRNQASLQAIAYEEYRLRQQAGAHPLPREYEERFGVTTTGWFPLNNLASASAKFVAAREAAADQRTQRFEPGELGADQAELVRAISTADARAGRHLSDALSCFPQVGETVAGFALVDELGSGAFAKVFLARQGKLANRLVALKISPDTFYAESQTLAQLQHTNIVPIYSVHHLHPFVGVCMPYFGSVTLAHVLQELRSQKTLPQSGNQLVSTLQDSLPAETTLIPQGQPLLQPDALPEMSASTRGPAPGPAPARPATTALQQMRQMSYVEAVLWIIDCLAQGLQHAHERGILHRDLKPANILLTQEGQPMLLDFNLAEDVKQPARVAAAKLGGTLPYMAPEHLEALLTRSSTVDARADVYALGVILYELLTGKHPFIIRKEPWHEVVPLMLQDRAVLPASPRRFNPAVTPAVAALVLHCLEPKPARRYQSARELETDLQNQLHHRPLRHAPDRSVRERLSKWARRHPRMSSVYTATALAACLIAVLLGLLFVQRQRQVALDAAEALHALDGDMPRIRFLLADTGAESAQQDEGMALCRRHAERFGVLDSPHWLESAQTLALDDEQRGQLRDDMGELLWFWARALTRKTSGPANQHERGAQFELGLRLNTLGAACFPAEETPAPVLRQQARLLEALDRSDEARKWRDQAGQSAAHSVQNDYFLLYECMDRGEYRHALAYGKKIAEVEPNNSAVLLLLGNCYWQAHQPDRARLFYDLGVDRDPGSPWALFNRGLLRLHQKEYAGARHDFAKVLELRPGLVEARMNRAVAALALKDPAAAERDLTAALEGGAPYTRLWFMRAEARAQLRDFDGAQKDREEGLRREPADDQSCVSRGMARLRNRDVPGALSDFDKALALNPRCQFALQNKASVLSEYLKKTQKAVTVLDQAVRHYPESVPALAGRGVLLARLGRRLEAHSDGKTALALSNDPEVYYQVSNIYALTSPAHPEDRKEALRLLRSALIREKQWLQVLPHDPDMNALRDDPEFQALVRHAAGLHQVK